MKYSDKRPLEMKITDSYQTYTYTLKEKAGENFAPDFKPDLNPKEMLELGVFGGLYFGDKPSEFPAEWWTKAKLAQGHIKDKNLNYFKINASQSLSAWEKKGWIYPSDPRGWFQWYCRYYLGRRTKDDEKQIKRWKAYKRHLAQVVKNCRQGDTSCRRKQRQSLLHWAYDSRKI